MLLSDRWKDFEVLDAGGGERLERWGDYLLRRPDPQVLWDTEKVHPGWNSPDAVYHRSEKGGGSWECFRLPERWTVHYPLRDNDKDKDGDRVLRFQLKPFSFKHTGLFPEQAVNWDFLYGALRMEIRRRQREGVSERVKVLNLFAYTGGATLAAAAAGAEVVHVDASKGMVQWAKENAQLSGLSGAPVRYLVDDCVKFTEREIRRGRRYDVIVMDPPSYGRGPKGEIWKMEDMVYPLLLSVSRLLHPGSLFLLLNAYTTGLQPGAIRYLLEVTAVRSLGGEARAEELGLPVAGNGLVLPCGCTGIWTGAAAGGV